MRRVREITAKEENFRTEPIGRDGPTQFITIRRDYIEPEQPGAYVALVFRITGYDKDCDGSAMARLERVDEKGMPSGWEPANISLFPEEVVLEGPDELLKLASKEKL